MKRIVFILFFISICFSNTEYLILCPEGWGDLRSVRNFVDFKSICGLRTKLIEFPSDAEYAEVRDSITSVYYESSEELKYVLVLGSFRTDVMSGMFRTGSYEGGFTDIRDGSVASSVGYADINDDVFTNELYIGRFPANDTTEINMMLNRSIDYERNPNSISSGSFDPAGYEWLTKGVVSCDPEGASSTPENDSSYYYGIYHISNLASENGFAEVDTMLSYNFYENTEAFPNYDSLGGDSMVVKIENGLGFLVYRGCCSGVMWGRNRASYNVGFSFDRMALNNERMTPVIAANTCAGIINIGTEFMRAPNGGSVAYFSNSYVCSGITCTRLRTAKAMTFFDNVFLGRTLGESAELARRTSCGTIMGDDGCDETYEIKDFFLCQLMGDPSIKMWTSTPENIYVTHDDFYIPGDEYSFDVNVMDSDSMPVDNACVCITYYDEGSEDYLVYEKDFTDDDGNVSLDYELPVDSFLPMFIVVNKWNKLPYEGVLFP